MALRTSRPLDNSVQSLKQMENERYGSLCIQTAASVIRHFADAVAALPITEAMFLKRRGGLVNKSHCLIVLYYLDDTLTLQEMK